MTERPGMDADSTADIAAAETFPGSDPIATTPPSGIKADLDVLAEQPSRSAATRMFLNEGIQTLHAGEHAALALAEPSQHGLQSAELQQALAALLPDFGRCADQLQGLLAVAGRPPGPATAAATVEFGEVPAGALRDAAVATALLLAQERQGALCRLLRLTAEASGSRDMADTLASIANVQAATVARLAAIVPPLLSSMSGPLPADCFHKLLAPR